MGGDERKATSRGQEGAVAGDCGSTRMLQGDGTCFRGAHVSYTKRHPWLPLTPPEF